MTARKFQVNVSYPIGAPKQSKFRRVEILRPAGPSTPRIDLNFLKGLRNPKKIRARGLRPRARSKSLYYFGPARIF